MDIEKLHKIQIDNDFIEGVIQNNEYNDKIIDYYVRLQKDLDKSLGSNIEALTHCNKIWQLDKYEIQKIKDFKKTNLCKDKFCNNCKKVKQASRMTKFIPHLEKLEEEFDLYHVVLTVPNVEGHDYFKLKEVIKSMFDNYRKLNHYLLSIKKIKDLDFYQYCYVGGIRSLEVSFNNDSYHPHLHCIFVMKKDLNFRKTFINKYSIDKFGKKKLRKFSSFEILIQKIWYLLNNDIKVTKNNIDNLDTGYSCMVDKVDEKSYFEVFKYMTKSNNEKDEFLSYDNFKVLYFSLKSVRQIQGYGILYGIKDEDLSDMVDFEYNNLIEQLQEKESPLEVFEAPKDVLENNEYLVISRKKIFSYLRTL